MQYIIIIDFFYNRTIHEYFLFLLKIWISCYLNILLCQ